GQVRLVVELGAGRTQVFHALSRQPAPSDPMSLPGWTGRGAPVAVAGDLRAEALTLLAAELFGAAEAAFGMACDHIGTRRQFGRPLSSFQTLRHRAARDWVALEDIAVAILDAAESAGTGRDALRRARIAKAIASDLAPRIVENALHAHGAMGFAAETGLDGHLFRVRHAAVCLGGARGHYAALGAALLQQASIPEPTT
ncbi:MAG: acyl-CoA dehydrogenase family protein, partial [Jannaschia sp.]